MDAIILNDLFIIKTRVFHGQQIFGSLQDSTRVPILFGLPPLEWTSVVGVYEPVPGLSLERVSSPSCYYPSHVFFHVMQPYDSVEHRLTILRPLINHQIWY